MKIHSLGKILVGTLLAVNLIVVMIGYNWIKGFNALQNEWQNSSPVIERKTTLLALLHETLGYGGMIHSLKNYILRVDKQYLMNTHRTLHELNIAIVAYRQQPLSIQEKGSLAVLEQIYQSYQNAAIKVEKLHMQGVEIMEIDRLVTVNDQQALRALQVLNKHVSDVRHQHIDGIASQVELIDRLSVIYATLVTLLLFGLAGYFSWSIRRQLIAPMKALLKAFDGIDPGQNATERLPVATKGICNELDEVAMAGNRFLDVVEAQLLSRDKAERKATESEHRISTILNSTADGIITINEKGIVLSYNSACETLFGYSANEVIAANVAKLMRPRDREAHQAYVENAGGYQRKVVGQNRELIGRKKDGSLFPMELTVTSTLIDNQLCYIGVLHDISARKANEEKLLAAKNEAENANQAKSQFLSSMSHELRTPLNAILGFGQLLMMNKKSPLSDINRSNTEQILQAGQHLLTLINEVLDMAKVEAGNVDVEFNTVDLAEVMEECLELVVNQAELAEITINVDNSIAQAPTVYSSFTRLKQVIVNLLTNAIKYNRRDGKVEISCKSLESQFLQIDVTDSGVGISEENRKQVFKPFARFDKNAIEIEGTGIGLNVCASLIKAMKGHIGFTSVEGQGSTFYIRIPLKAEVADGQASADEKSKQILESIGYSDKTLLYIHDKPANLDALETILTDISDIEFLSIDGGGAGIELAKAKQPDLLFIDIQLADISGIEVLQQLGQIPATARTPMIALTTDASLKIRQKCLEAGFSAVLAKPFTIVKIAKTICRAMESPRA